MGIISIGVGNCTLGRRQTDRDGNVVSETPAKWEADPAGSCVAIVPLEPVPMEEAEGLHQWVILGAETGNRKGKVIPRREWVDQITAFCKSNEIPVFYKGNLREYFPDLPASVFPWEV